MYKILATHLKVKLIKSLDSDIGEYQCGFRSGRSVVDQIYILREVQAESYEYKKETYVAFIDFRQAFDRIKRNKLYEALQELAVNKKLINMIKLTLKETDNRVRIQGNLSEKFEVHDGVRQGDPLSSVLFICALEYVIRKAKINRTGLLYYKRHQCLAFADDLVIMTRSKKELQQAILKLEKEAEVMGLEINEHKTKFMTWTDKDFEKGELRVVTDKARTYAFEEVDHFTYLGTEFYRKPDIKKEIQRRIMSGNRTIHSLKRFMYNKTVSRGLKLRIYETIIRPVVIFASEVWTLGTMEQKMLKVWERKVLRKIYGGKRVHDMWERRSNRELMELYKQPDIIGIVKAQRLRWLGHIMRMQESRIPNILLESTIGGKKRRGRPKARWKDEVISDMRYCRIANWREKTRDKKAWRKEVHQAMGLLGLQS